MAKITAFGKEIGKKLIDMEQPQAWLLAKVREKTGLYFDNSYLYKIKTGQISSPKIVRAIREILDLSEDKQDSA